MLGGPMRIYGTLYECTFVLSYCAMDIFALQLWARIQRFQLREFESGLFVQRANIGNVLSSSYNSIGRKVTKNGESHFDGCAWYCRYWPTYYTRSNKQNHGKIQITIIELHDTRNQCDCFWEIRCNSAVSNELHLLPPLFFFQFSGKNRKVFLDAKKNTTSSRGIVRECEKKSTYSTEV